MKQEINTKHTDIKSKGWIRYLPQKAQPYALLARLDRPIGIWLLLLPGLWAIMLAAQSQPALNDPFNVPLNAHTIKIALLFTLGAILMRAAGCVINDLWDRDLDKAVERTRLRPLASGALQPPQALIFLGAILIGALVILLQMNVLTILLGVLSLPLIALYPLMKRWTWWPQAFLGLIFNFSALMGWSAMTGTLELPTLFLYLSGIFWTLGYDTVYAHQDTEDDALIGIRSTALKLGAHSKIYVAGFYALSWVFTALAVLQVSAPLYVLLLIPAALHLIIQLKRWNVHDPAHCLEIFKSNRNYGLIILAAFIIMSQIG